MGKFNKDIIFKGAATALVTPFDENGAVDYKAFAKLIDFQIDGGIDALVICGTTGEGSTLTDEEHRECIRFSVEHIAGRVPVIAGTGSNDTDYANSLSKYACDVGADALLLVTPYYNKATPKGLIKSFLDTAEKTDKPIILYNVPSRTGVNITMPVYRELAKHERIVAVKEASGNMSQIAEIAAELSDDLAIYSGNDDQIVPILSLGGQGVISVLSNVMPKETHDICQKFFDGDVAGSRELQLKYLELINNLFIEVNPIPVKTACGLMNLCSDLMRLPLCEMDDANKAKLAASMAKAGLI
ncbi:MAG: 4-hydroxy-tetrahydrodipicolinate synthase [Clostridia bacterium]|nr:4-hydroxy-tetrahydrodipicolinate synthase [Oscillospiraceae bacterium]MBO4931535.1 4-hydroxy-tetrahydrodipicolinate synthase [Clostridia bacterium]MBQ7313152.1 4-hydroxy-tetrahydrodipicolinate synthase [Clostridia bacterium]